MVKAKPESRGAPKKKGEKMQIATRQGPEDAAGPRIDSRIQREIGKHLRAHYIDVVNEPVPDRLMELLEQLEQSVTRKKT